MPKIFLLLFLNFIEIKKILDNNFLDYISYWNEKYYRNGFVDGVQMIVGCVEE